MNTATKVLVGSGVFGLVVGGAYWVVTYEPAGFILLVSFGVAPLLVAGYLWLQLRGASPGPEDRGDARPEDAAGPVGTFVAASAWPVILAAAALLLAGGLVFGVWLLLPAGALFAFAAIGFARE